MKTSTLSCSDLIKQEVSEWLKSGRFMEDLERKMCLCLRVCLLCIRDNIWILDIGKRLKKAR